MDIPNNLKVILIAEDSPTQAEKLGYFLEQHGYQVLAAKNGREALDLMARYKPDLLISDIVMPEMDGYELCHCIRSDQGMKDLPIIFLTMLSNPADIMKSLECGADSFIIKPFKEEPLIERIRLLLASQDLRKHEEKQEPVEVVFRGQKYRVNADRLQIMNLLISTYEAAVETNSELRKAQGELQDLSAELAAQGEELQLQNDELSTLAEELRDSEARTQRQALILAGINRIFHEALTSRTEEELGGTCLAVAEELTGSKFGFIAELNKDGNLDDLAISYLGWEACKIPGPPKLVLPKNFHIHGIFGVCLREKRSEIVNNPSSHPDRVGIPEGHPPITAFLGVPLKHGGKTIGMIGLANKEGGYTQADQEAVEALSVAAVEALMRQRLETRVKEHTVELEAANRKLKFANRELESFSYSVSHDLKAPIRAIQGFCRMLVGEHTSGLDGEGRRLLDVIVNNTQIMTKLIDDLLALSQVGRHQIRRSHVDLAALARQVFKRLGEQEPGREIRLTVKELPTVWGDPSLINQIMVNLLDNAIKYTRAKKTAAIEVGCQAAGSEDVCHIKDNGIGFDERYADKLFGVFQRLHGGPEYEGTGVGLAIVQRIIQRHGGRVWAEGKVGEGATFYFALPKNVD